MDITIIKRKLKVYQKFPNYYKLSELKLLLRELSENEINQLNITDKKLLEVYLNDKKQIMSKLKKNDINENNIIYKNDINNLLYNLIITKKIKLHTSEKFENNLNKQESIKEEIEIFDDILEEDEIFEQDKDINKDQEQDKDQDIEKIDEKIEKIDKYESDISEDYSVYEEEGSDNEFSS
jgi:hypothetical protein